MLAVRHVSPLVAPETGLPQSKKQVGQVSPFLTRQRKPDRGRLDVRKRFCKSMNYWDCDRP